MKYSTKLKGKFRLSEADILRFHPWIKPFIEEVKSKGWNYEFSNVIAEVLVELNLDELVLTLSYHPPRIERCEEEGVYEISARLGEEPAIMKVLSIDRFNVDVFPEHCLHAVEVDPFKREVKRIKDVLWDGLGEKCSGKLDEARDVYEIAKWLIEEKGFKASDDYVVKNYKKLVDIFEKPYRFNLTLEVTVKDESKVPSWKDLKKELHNFFYERGLLVELKRGNEKLFDLFKKPLP
jgi:hypothetical protein